MLALFERAFAWRERRAVRSGGRDYTYGQLLDRSESMALRLLDDRDDLAEERIAFMVEPGFDYVVTQWAIWRAGGIAVPLCLSYPLPALQHVIEDSQASAIVSSDTFEAIFSDYAIEKGLPLILLNKQLKKPTGQLPILGPTRNAMILYTSGTTGSPKGVVLTHGNLEAQITSLVKAWEWDANDHILNVLPLHHIHGIVNILGCALWSGACCEFLSNFDEKRVFEIIKEGELTLFMAVPTIYHKLIRYWQGQTPKMQKEISRALKNLRLMVSGSAALPVSVMDEWEKISGHRLLERYGMTEIGMGISNPYRGERVPGHIGQPLPGVEIRLLDENGKEVENGANGEIHVKGDNVFKEYWKRPEASEKAFTFDGWFRTGDIACLDNSSYRIIGRSSVDIIKSGGYKISALEIEEVLRTHHKIRDCGVVGIPDQEWGELIVAGLILEEDTNKMLNIRNLNSWIRQFLPGYKVPRRYIFLDDLPRNAMGKVTKNKLKELFNE